MQGRQGPTRASPEHLQLYPPPRLHALRRRRRVATPHALRPPAVSTPRQARQPRRSPTLHRPAERPRHPCGGLHRELHGLPAHSQWPIPLLFPLQGFGRTETARVASGAQAVHSPRETGQRRRPADLQRAPAGGQPPPGRVHGLVRRLQGLQGRVWGQDAPMQLLPQRDGATGWTTRSGASRLQEGVCDQRQRGSQVSAQVIPQ
mmetsp:Transcript_56810/g.123482  ORF Transcript_56810/g.123482 Transcript_56810/m.123482 type:complete len:204 (+) Transcript_56810:183-794(+)